MNTRFLLALALLTLLVLPALADPAPGATKPADIANMKAIGAALNAFKKAKGEFPEHLSDLVPDFLEAKTLVSPLGVEADPRAANHRYDPKLPCTYPYEFSTEPYRSTKFSTRMVRTIELEEYGLTTPLLRCFLYDRVLNLSHAGEVFESTEEWEKEVDAKRDSEVKQLIKKYGLGTGAQAGKKLRLTLTNEAGQPLPGVALATLVRKTNGLHLPDRQFTSDAQGRVTIPLGLDPKPSVTFFGRSDDWFLGFTSWTFGDAGAAIEGEVASLTKVLLPAGPIGGTVRDHHGAPLPQADIEIPGVWEAKATTDAQGRWKIGGIPKRGIPADATLVISHPGNRSLSVEPTAESSPTAAALLAQTADIQLPPPFAIRGTVVAGGQPVPKAKVYFDAVASKFQHESLTDAQGNFEVLLEDEGATTISVVAPDFAPLFQAVKISAADKPLQLAIEAGRPLKGRVTSPQGAGVGNAPIILLGVFFGPPLGEKPVIATTDENGRFTWPHAPAKGTIWCRVLVPEGEPYGFTWDTSQNDELVIHLGQ